jgi:hypothetical protein
MLFSCAVRAVYLESSSMFVHGGVYRAAREASGTAATFSVSALTCSLDRSAFQVKNQFTWKIEKYYTFFGNCCAMIPHKLTQLFGSRLPAVPTSVHPLNGAFQLVEFQKKDFGVTVPCVQDGKYHEESQTCPGLSTITTYVRNGRAAP